jgi:hypothetical protein
MSIINIQRLTDRIIISTAAGAVAGLTAALITKAIRTHLHSEQRLNRIHESKFRDFELSEDDLGLAELESKKLSAVNNQSVKAVSDLVIALEAESACGQAHKIAKMMRLAEDTGYGFPETIAWENKELVIACAFHAVTKNKLQFERGIGGLRDYLEGTE